MKIFENSGIILKHLQKFSQCSLKAKECENKVATHSGTPLRLYVHKLIIEGVGVYYMEHNIRYGKLQSTNVFFRIEGSTLFFLH